ncbi:hypothetical protein WJX81_004856 [Elliptochloris bilobata]|uniref:TFIIE beta domain-containing protein n=1 Tax=Elliptochloris bilobata TaxID=381761 RepID=A0AAW1RCV6_9CHLO
MSALQKALNDFRARQAGVAATQVKDAESKKKKAAPKREPKAGRGGRGGRGRGRGAATEAAGAAPDKGWQTARLSRGGVPLAKQLKDVLDLLLEVRVPLGVEEIEERSKHSAADGTPLAEALRASAKVDALEDGRFRYKATHEVAGREGLLALLQRAPDGTRLGDLRDAYPGAADDAAALAAEGQIWLLPGGDTFDSAAFPRLVAPMPVSEDIAAQWHATEVPADPATLEEELRRAGVVPAVRAGVRRRAPPPPKERKKRAYRPRHVTNVHMPELFRDAAPSQID